MVVLENDAVRAIQEAHKTGHTTLGTALLGRGSPMGTGTAQGLLSRHHDMVFMIGTEVGTSSSIAQGSVGR